MNRSKIEWTDMTWNPVTGCKRNCEYCYAKQITKRFGRDSGYNRGIGRNTDGMFTLDTKTSCIVGGQWEFDPYPRGFEPTFHRYRLEEPKKRNKPTKIFTVSMGDLFGKWVPESVINAVLDVARDCPQHTFQFLTKNPQRYLGPEVGWEKEGKKIKFPDNTWAGVTVTDHYSWIWAHCRLRHVEAKVKFISFEPLLKPVVDLVKGNGIPRGVDWIIIGAMTGPGAAKPEREWKKIIINAAREREIPIFLKDNLDWPEKIREWPE